MFIANQSLRLVIFTTKFIDGKCLFFNLKNRHTGIGNVDDTARLVTLKVLQLNYSEFTNYKY